MAKELAVGAADRHSEVLEDLDALHAQSFLGRHLADDVVEERLLLDPAEGHVAEDDQAAGELLAQGHPVGQLAVAGAAVEDDDGADADLFHDLQLGPQQLGAGPLAVAVDVDDAVE